MAGRYLFVGIISAGITSAVPDYRDLSFKIDSGINTLGQFSVFGIGGRSQIDFLWDKIDGGDLFAAEDEDSSVNASFRVVGLKQNYLVNDKTYIRTVIGGTFRENTFVQHRALYPEVLDNKSKCTEADTYENRFTISSYLNTKLSANQTIKAGLLH